MEILQKIDERPCPDKEKCIFNHKQKNFIIKYVNSEIETYLGCELVNCDR